MSRKKHSWNALWTLRENDATIDDIFNAERVVECAIAEDFSDSVYEETEQLLNMLEVAPNNDIKLGILLAQHAMRKTLDNWYS